MKYLYTLTYRVPNEGPSREYGFNALSDKSAVAKARGMLWGVDAYGIVLVSMKSETRVNLLTGYDPEESPSLKARDLIPLIAYWVAIGLIFAAIIHLFFGGWFGGIQ